MPQPPAIKHRKVWSFTLVELLVAITIFLLVAGVLSSITNSSSNVWQQGIAHADRRASALAVFDRITRDLRQAAQPTDYSGPRLQMVITGSGSTLVSGTYLNPQAMFWQSAVATDTSAGSGYGYKGNLAIVGYFVQWIGTTPKLCRLLVNPSSTDYAVYNGGTLPSPWLSSSLLSTYAPATQTAAYQGQLAENVLGFWAQALDQTLKPITRTAATSGTFSPGQFDSTKGYIYTSASAYTSGTITSGTMKYVGDSSVLAMPSPSPSAAGGGSLPASIEIAIVTVDSRTALKLSGAEKPASPTGNLWTDVNTFYNSLPVAIKKGAEIHSTIINLPDAPR
ncbi:MAG: hypothetical protein WCD79_07545 [Chthoniobacteraceae bacterium]